MGELGNGAIHAEFHDKDGMTAASCQIKLHGKSRAIMFLLGALLHKEAEHVYRGKKVDKEGELAVAMFCLSVYHAVADGSEIKIDMNELMKQARGEGDG